MTRAQIAGLAGAFVVVIALGTRVTRWSGFEGLVVPLLIVAGAGLLLFVGVQRLGGRGSYRVAVHTHGGHGTRLAARHEAGHYHVGKKVGGTVTGAEIYPDGSGITWVDIPCKAGPAAAVAVAVAGQVAAGTKRGCDGFAGSDFDFKRQILRSLPAHERAAVERQGYALARQYCNGLLSPVPSLAKRIYRDGKIR